MFFWNSKKCSKAIAYLKSAVPNTTSENQIDVPETQGLIIKSLGHGLLVTYVLDQRDRFEFIQNRHIEKEKLTVTELHSYGLQNLQKLADQRMRVQTYQNIFAVLMGGNFEASLILLDSIWDGPFRKFVTGQYAIVIPARDVLAFCDASSAAGCKELQDVIDRGKAAANIDHPLTNQHFVRVGTSWVPRDYPTPRPAGSTPLPAR